MDSEDITSSSKSNGFLEHMTKFDKKTKTEVLNMFQYGFLMVTPVMFVNKLVGVLFTMSPEEKTTLELGLEIVAELVVLFSSLFIIHRLVSYIPTYSEEPYPAIDFTQVVLVFVFILFSFQTSLNEKFNVIYERVFDGVPESLPGLARKEDPSGAKARGVVVSTHPSQQPTRGQQHIGKAQYVDQSAVQRMNPNGGMNVANSVGVVNQGLQIPSSPAQHQFPAPEFPQQYPPDNAFGNAPEAFGGF